MDKKCGQGRGSHVQMGKWLKEYGRAYAGKRVCASYNFGADIAWKAQPLPVWANGQMLGHWKSGSPRYKAGAPQYEAGEPNNKAADDGKKKDKAVDDGKKKDKTG